MNKIVYCVLIAFIIALIQGPILIPILHKLKFGQNIRGEGPESHKKKAGTPTMGGIIFITATIITFVLVEGKPNSEAMVLLGSLVGFGIIGFLDDILKIVKKQNEGLKSYQKMGLIIVMSVILAIYGRNQLGTDIFIPFFNSNMDLGVLYIPFIVFYFAAFSNAVNLTDGLDGLATSITLLVMTFLALVSFAQGRYELAIFSAILAGALLGFLRNNTYPARIFMGDTGALALGGVVAAVAMLLKLPLLLVVIGGVYVIETVSVVLQVASFKLTGKRIFKMAPLHHHFELSGWHESKIVVVFSMATVILCLIGFLALSL
ncbi:MAG: phospho-N-acetylmuramoyl-pentapeptide-transferase [Clostridium sp.]